MNKELKKIIITEHQPENEWTIEYNTYNSIDAVVIPKKLAKALLKIKKLNLK